MIEPVDDYSGDCLLVREIGEYGRVVNYVARADERVRISSEALCQIIEGRMPGVEFGEGMVRLGTDGHGLGLVTYEVDDPRFLDWQRGRIKVEWLTMQRVYLSENANSQ